MPLLPAIFGSSRATGQYPGYPLRTEHVHGCAPRPEEVSQAVQTARQTATVVRGLTGAVDALEGVLANTTTEAFLATPGAAPVLIGLLHAPATAARVAARLVAQLGTSEANATLLREAGAIPPLVKLLDLRGDYAARHAADALQNLAAGGPNRNTIREAGAIAPLVRLLTGGSDLEASRCAAGALRNLAYKCEANKEAAREAGAIAPLVTLLHRAASFPSLAANAASALKNLACANPLNQTAILEAEGVPLLVRLLGPDPDTPVARHAAWALRHVLPMAELLTLAPRCAAVTDSRGQMPLHVLCANPTLEAETKGVEMLQALVRAHPAAVLALDAEGKQPVQYLIKNKPEAGDLWAVLMKAEAEERAKAGSAGAPAEAGRAAAPGGPLAAGGDATASSKGGGGGGGGSGGGSGGGGGGGGVYVRANEVTGIRGRVKDVLEKGAHKQTRAEDRGLILFTSSMTAVKVTAEACRQAAGLLEALLIDFEARDVFVNLEYANQLRRLAKDEAEAGGAPAPAAATNSLGLAKALPELPRLYANGKLIGTLAELKRLDDEGLLGSELQQYAIDHQRGRDVAARSCDECGGRRFVVCIECKGSCRGREVFGKFLKCSRCNENGLMACPSCNAEELERSTAVVTEAAEAGEWETRA